ncbi:MAG: sensor histidine kinase, partial [bacterium]
MSISRKLLIALLLLTIIPLTIISIVLYENARTNIKKKTILSIAGDLNATATRIDEFIRSSIVNVKSWSEQIVPKLSLEYNRRRPLEEYLNDNMREYGNYDAMLVVDGDGNLFANNTYSWAQRRADGYLEIVKALANKECLADYGDIKVVDLQSEDVLANSSGVDSAMIIVAPIFNDENKLLGKLYVFLSAEPIKKIMDDLQARYQTAGLNSAIASIWVVGGRGIKGIFSANYNAGAQYGSINKIFQEGDFGEMSNGVWTREVEADGKKLLFAMTNIKSSVQRVDKYWYVSMSASENEIFRSLSAYTKSSLYSLVTIAFLVTMFSLLLGGNISKPILKLKRYVQGVCGEGMGRDISELIVRKDEIGELAKAFVTMENNLEIYQNDLRLSAKMSAIGQLSSHIAHDMRSPLSALKAYLGMSEQWGEFNEIERAESKAAAERSVEKLLRMANDLVDYAKASNINRKAVSICGIIDDEVMTELRDAIRERNIALRSLFKRTIWANLDADKIGRVLVNLVNNSMQAIADSGGEIDIISAEPEGNDLLLCVADNGKGIEPEHLSRIFDSFFTSGKKGGTGLGLAYCKQVVEAHGGTIDVESEVGKGTKFTIRIPSCVVQEGEAAAAAAAASTALSGTAAATDLRATRYLIVDDDPDIRAQWQRIIGERGGRIIHTASSADEMIMKNGFNFKEIDA